MLFSAFFCFWGIGDFSCPQLPAFPEQGLAPSPWSWGLPGDLELVPSPTVLGSLPEHWVFEGHPLGGLWRVARTVQAVAWAEGDPACTLEP